MVQHLAGRRHCTAVARRHLRLASVRHSPPTGSAFLHPVEMSEKFVLGFGVTHDYFGWKKARFLISTRPRILHAFVHPGKILKHLRWMQEQTSQHTQHAHQNRKENPYLQFRFRVPFCVIYSRSRLIHDNELVANVILPLQLRRC